MANEIFRIDGWEKLKPETAKFIFEEAEKNLIECLESGKHVTTRAATIIGFCLPIFGALIGYIFNEIIHNRITGFHFWIPVVVVVPIIAILVLSIDAYWIYKRSPLGNEPINIVNKEKIESDHQEVLFLVKRIESIQRQIIKNSERNDARFKILRKIDLIVVTSLIASIITCLYHYFFYI